MSASLFVIAMNPFLLKFKEIIVDKSYGVLYACADDLGSSLLRISSLLQTHCVFKVMASVAGLHLNTKKCVIIPLVPKDSSTFLAYHEWLVQHIPEWSEFKVASHGEYLGFEVGPAAGEHQWVKVHKAFSHALAVVANSGAPLSIAVFTYNKCIRHLNLFIFLEL